MENCLKVYWSHLLIFLHLSCLYLPLVAQWKAFLSCLLLTFSLTMLSDFLCDLQMFLSKSVFSSPFNNNIKLFSPIFCCLFNTSYLLLTGFLFTPIFSPLLTVSSPHFYRSPLSLIPSVEPYWEGLDASRYRPQPSSRQWVCQLLSPFSYTLCTLVQPQLLRILTCLHATGQMSPQGNNKTGCVLPLMNDEGAST